MGEYLNILFLSETYYPHYGGAELASHLYSKMLGEKRHKITVLTNRHKDEAEKSVSQNEVIYRLDLINELTPKYSTLSRIDVLNSSFFKRLVNWSDLVYIPRYWFSAIPFVKKMGKPVIVHLHDYIPVCPLSNLYDASREEICTRPNCSPQCIWAAERYQENSQYKAFASTILNTTVGGQIGKLVSQADAVICVSKKHRQVLLERAPHLKDKLHVVYNPMPEISNIELEGEDFGFFGGTNRLKGLNVLKNALQKISKDKRPKVHSTQLKSKLHESELNKLKQTGIIPYSRLSRDDFNKMYGSIQTVIIPSIWHEPLPYVVAEAQLRGRMIIASNIGGIPELVKGSEGVILCEPGNPTQLSESIYKVMEMSYEDKLELGKQNRDNFSKRFSNEKNLKDFLKIVQSLASK